MEVTSWDALGSVQNYGKTIDTGAYTNFSPFLPPPCKIPGCRVAGNADLGLFSETYSPKVLSGCTGRNVDHDPGKVYLERKS